MKLPACSFASSVVSHSPYTDENPCEKIGWFVSRSITSK